MASSAAMLPIGWEPPRARKDEDSEDTFVRDSRAVDVLRPFEAPSREAKLGEGPSVVDVFLAFSKIERGSRPSLGYLHRLPPADVAALILRARLDEPTLIEAVRVLGRSVRGRPARGAEFVLQKAVAAAPNERVRRAAEAMLRQGKVPRWTQHLERFLAGKSSGEVTATKPRAESAGSHSVAARPDGARDEEMARLTELEARVEHLYDQIAALLEAGSPPRNEVQRLTEELEVALEAEAEAAEAIFERPPPDLARAAELSKEAQRLIAAHTNDADPAG